MDERSCFRSARSIALAAILASGSAPLVAADAVVASRRMAVSPGVTIELPPGPARALPYVEGATPAEVAEALDAFLFLTPGPATQPDAVSSAVSRSVARLRQAGLLEEYRRFGLYPSDPAAFAERVEQMLDEGRAMTRELAAAMCARRSDLLTVDRYLNAKDQAGARLAAWKVRRFREFKASLPADDLVAKDLTPAGVIVMRSDAQRMSVIEYPVDYQFQAWVDHGCKE